MAEDDVFVDDVPHAARLVGHFVQDVEHHLFHDRTQTTCAGAFFFRKPGDRVQRLRSENQFRIIHAEKLRVLLDERVFRLFQDSDHVVDRQFLEGRDDWQTTDEFGNQTELDVVLARHAR